MYPSDTRKRQEVTRAEQNSPPAEADFAADRVARDEKDSWGRAMRVRSWERASSREAPSGRWTLEMTNPVSRKEGLVPPSGKRRLDQADPDYVDD